jgi:hypothetical protein
VHGLREARHLDKTDLNEEMPKLTPTDLEYACSNDVQDACDQAGALRLGNLVPRMAHEILEYHATEQRLFRWATRLERSSPFGAKIAAELRACLKGPHEVDPAGST